MFPVVESFKLCPDEVYVNDIIQDSPGFKATLTEENSTVKIRWNYTFTNCNSMFYKLDNILEIDLLNSSLMPSTKREIISKINNLAQDKKYILISTQSVEAGVDVSFDFVVRDFAIIDSIEQIRGRCNRSREINKLFYRRYKLYKTKNAKEGNYDLC